MSKPGAEELVLRYLAAKERLIHLGFATEIDWQQNRRLSDITESDLLREVAWVILSSGMRETVVRSKFEAVSKAFYYWRSSQHIVERQRTCLSNALVTFNHIGKMRAIVATCRIVQKSGFSGVISQIIEHGVEYIRGLPYMGPVTSYHLAKNLGVDIVKPDRHLSRISNLLGYDSPYALCSEIARNVGDKLSVVDVVLWRYSTLFRYEQLLAESFS